MNKAYFNQMMLDRLKKQQKRLEEKEEYEEAFNKLSIEERDIINIVQRKIDSDNLKERLIRMEKEYEERRRGRKKEIKKDIKEYTKMIEDDRINTERRNVIATGVVGVLAFIGLTIITR
jgi:hypothetical protein